MTFSSEVLEIETDGPIATLWLNRPDKRNALGRDFWTDLPNAAEALSLDPALRVVVLAARGPHFSVGLDLKEMGGSLGSTGSTKPTSRSASNYASYQQIRKMQDAITSLELLAIPVIAAIHGYCIGGGVDLVCACDIRLASADTIFSVREAKVAIVADMGTLQRLPKIIGQGHVNELALTAKDIPAKRAAKIGLVNHVAGDNFEDVLEAAYEMAHEIAANSPIAVQGTKAVLRANDGATLNEGLNFVAHWNAAYIQSNDLVEAMTAFVERRPADFKGD